MPITLRDIAEHTGLSRPTVTRILGRDAHYFAPETRDKVLRAAAELGYRPNAAAKAIGSGRFNCAALVMGHDTGRSNLPLGLLLGLHDELARHDMHLTICRLPDHRLTETGFVPKVLRQNMADGMLINYNFDIPQRMIDLIRAHHAPAVWLNTDLTTDCVRPNDVGGGRLITEHLLKMGHRRVAYAMFDWSNHYSGRDRHAGYEAAMREVGLAPRSVPRDVSVSDRVDLARTLLADSDRPTAVIVRPEDAPTFAYVAATLRLRFPDDLSIASISGGRSFLLDRWLTASLVPSEKEGRQAVDMLTQKITNPGTEMPVEVVQFMLESGATCAPPPA